MSVRAFQPNRHEPPVFIAEDLDELAEKLGEHISGPQCEYCGNSCYRIDAVGHGSPEPIRGYSARCVTDPDTDYDDPEQPWRGCERGFPISVWEEDLVAF